MVISRIGKIIREHDFQVNLEQIVHHTCLPKKLRIGLIDATQASFNPGGYGITAALESASGEIGDIELLPRRSFDDKSAAEKAYQEIVDYINDGKYCLHSYSDGRVELEVPFTKLSTP